LAVLDVLRKGDNTVAEQVMQATMARLQTVSSSGL